MSENYSYHLEKYQSKASRHTCPSCGHAGTFTLYVDEQGKPLADNVGRCNREDNCGWHYTPKQYFADHPEMSKKDYSFDVKKFGKTEQPAPQPKPLCRIPKEFLINSVSPNSDFIFFLCSIFDRNTIDSPTIWQIIKTYYLGATRDGGTVFWQMDGMGKIHAGKIIHYDGKTGHRDHDRPINWVHSIMKKQGKLSDDWELTQCLFGEHLLHKRPDAPVALFEAEKTACICSVLMPDFVCVAVGGKQNLNARLLIPLMGRKVTVFPDLQAFGEWKEKLNTISQQVGFSCYMCDVLEKVATDEEKSHGLDVADYLIKELQRRSSPQISIKRH